MLLGLGVLAAIASTLDFEALLRTLGGASPGWLGLAVLLYLPAWVLRGQRWRQVAADLGDAVPLSRAVGLAVVGNMLNLALPAKAGDLLWANAAARLGSLPYARALVGVLAGRVLDLGVLMALGLAVLPALPGGWARWGSSLAYGSGTLLAALVLGAWVARRRLLAPLLPPRLLALHDAFAQPLAALSGARLPLHLGTTALIWGIEVAVAALVARALGLSVGLLALPWAILVANLSKVLPLTPASFGTYELAGAVALRVVDLDHDRAFALMLAEHLLKNGVNLALGLVALAGMDLPLLSRRRP